MIYWHTMKDHIVEGSDGWYWCDETGDPSGPCDTKEAAQKKIKEYCHWLDTGELPDATEGK
jgi:hypothetical protein